MRVIIDTNVLVSAILKGRKPREIIQLITENPEIDWMVSKEILAEYQELLHRKKFKLTEQTRAEWLKKIVTIPKLIEVKINYNFPRDQKDAKFIACAIASNADFLITGDKDFDDVSVIGNTIIISVSKFKEIFIS